MTHSNAEPDLEQQSRYSPILDRSLVALYHREQVNRKRTHRSQKVISRKTRLRGSYEERTVIGNGGANARKSKISFGAWRINSKSAPITFNRLMRQYGKTTVQHDSTSKRKRPRRRETGQGQSGLKRRRVSEDACRLPGRSFDNGARLTGCPTSRACVPRLEKVGEAKIKPEISITLIKTRVIKLSYLEAPYRTILLYYYALTVKPNQQEPNQINVNDSKSAGIWPWCFFVVYSGLFYTQGHAAFTKFKSIRMAAFAVLYHRVIILSKERMLNSVGIKTPRMRNGLMPSREASRCV
ncbi:hypothetical protein G5I_11398 [Acromyrmex echinatior]|uniref:Uncharacterized protein n=1 Tax=Acromyrmex echinatior TaxID=103372 RepID=F4WZH4_ACREC|nr:hypothetical protein G5I_11398 [Acromyrmex echinatior]